ncbi:MAG: hypothetical protein IKN82_08880 [Treponema sp.]|nr:hypothetical protein [Treponema sp.]
MKNSSLNAFTIKNFYLSTMLMELRCLFLFQKSNIGTRENVENEAG